MFFIILLIAAAGFFLPRFLYKNNPVNAEILVAEGWLPEEALAEAIRIYDSGKYQIFVVAGVSAPEEVNMSSFGKLIFSIKDYAVIKSDRHVTTVGVNAFGKKAAGEYPHFRLFVNDSLTGNAYVSSHKKNYNFSVDRNIKDINNISIEYDNDAFTYWRDRNLYVNYVSIDSIQFPARSEHVLYDMNKAGDYRQLEPHFTSHSDYSACILKVLGFKDSVIAITALNANISRTYSSALYFKKWYMGSPFKGRYVNIVSVGLHTRRTWMVYKKVLGRDTDVGVILIDSEEYNKYNWWKSLAGIKDTVCEMASYIYTVIVLPFVNKDLEEQ